MSKEYIIVTYKDGEIWYARFDKEKGYYTQDGLEFSTRKGDYLTETEIDVDNTVFNSSVKVKEISEKDYYTYICMKISRPINEEIKEHEKKIKELKNIIKDIKRKIKKEN